MEGFLKPLKNDTQDSAPQLREFVPAMMPYFHGSIWFAIFFKSRMKAARNDSEILKSTS